jgi:hypothetical protein
MTHPSNAAGLTLWQQLIAPQGFVTAVLIEKYGEPREVGLNVREGVHQSSKENSRR